MFAFFCDSTAPSSMEVPIESFQRFKKSNREITPDISTISFHSNRYKVFWFLNRILQIKVLREPYFYFL